MFFLSKKTRLRTCFLNKNNSLGFSLIQTAIGLMVLGTIGTGMMQGYNVYQSSQEVKKNEGVLASIENSINQFFFNGNTRYPCPASFIAGEDDNNFGNEIDCSDLSTIKLCSDEDWKNDGICKTDDTDDAVIIGAVPFDALGITYENTLDTWHTKIVYAVTHEQTSKDDFDKNTGAINITTKLPNVTDIGIKDFDDNKPDFILISLGENKLGGFNKDSTPTGDCPTPDNGHESENCDFDNMFFAQSDPDNSGTGARSSILGIEYYDDFTRYQLNVPIQNWFNNPDEPGRVMTLSDKVGIGTADPRYSLHVVGNIKVPGKVMATYYCADNMSDCFDPKLITEEEEQMRCEDSVNADLKRGMVKMGSNRLHCNAGVDNGTGTTPEGGVAFDLDDTAFKPQRCAGNQLMKGFDNTGTPICEEYTQ